MSYRVLSSDSKELTFICGLGWPEVARYYLSQRQRGLWEFWEQRPGSTQARMIFGWLAEETRPEIEVAQRLLADYLGTFRPETTPREEFVQGLLSFKEIERVLARHRARGEYRLLSSPRRPPAPRGPSAA